MIIKDGKLTSTQQFQAGDGIQIIEVPSETDPSIITRYLQLKLDDVTLGYNDNGNVIGKYEATAPLTLTQSQADKKAVIALQYDDAAFQLI